MTLFGIDTSKHNGAIDWAAVARANIDFFLSRAMLATTPDLTYPANYRNARENGLIGGPYHFLYDGHWVSGAKQCDAFVGVIGDPKGKIVALDVEVDHDRSGNVVSRPVWADVMSFVDRWKVHYPGHPLLIYGSAFLDLIAGGRGAAAGPLWRARYVDPIWAAGKTAQTIYGAVPASWWGSFDSWAHPTILQFSSVARVPGLADPTVDVNAFRGTREDLLKLTGGTVAPPSPEGQMREVTRETPALIDVPDNAPYYTLDGTHIGELQQAYPGRSSPFACGTLAAMYATSGGIRQLVLVKPTATHPVPTADCTTQVATAKTEATATERKRWTDWKATAPA